MSVLVHVICQIIKASQKHAAQMAQIFLVILSNFRQLTGHSQHCNACWEIPLNDYTCHSPALSWLCPVHTGQVLSIPETQRNSEASEANGTVSQYLVCPL